MDMVQELYKRMLEKYQLAILYHMSMVCHINIILKLPPQIVNDKMAAFAYILGYIAKTGRSSNPWSERKMGVYHEFSNRRELWVILQPTKVALDLPSSYLSLSKHRMSPHTLLFSSSFPTSTAYLQYLENQIKTKVPVAVTLEERYTNKFPCFPEPKSPPTCAKSPQ